MNDCSLKKGARHLWEQPRHKEGRAESRRPPSFLSKMKPEQPLQHPPGLRKQNPPPAQPVAGSHQRQGARLVSPKHPAPSVPHRARWQRRMGSMLSLPSLKQVLKKGQYLSAETWWKVKRWDMSPALKKVTVPSWQSRKTPTFRRG